MNHKISELLIKKYLQIKRDLPWRDIDDPYKIWLSEVILQQTRVNQGLPYYLNFVSRYPSVSDLASASEDEVLKLWQGLGYYSRARNMLATAKEVMLRFNGTFPKRYADLLSLKGIGEYTAAAVASFAAAEAVPVVDGNVIRVLSRLFAVETEADSVAGKKLFKALASELLHPKRPDLHNQAIMEFGALVCTPKNPSCADCPLSDSCHAFQAGTVSSFPHKKPKKASRNRYFIYTVFSNGKELLIERREDAGIWKGLYQFPLIETASLAAEEEIPAILNDRFKALKYSHVQVSEPVKHVLSHQNLFIRFVGLKMKQLPQNEQALRVTFDAIGQYAFPVVIANYLNSQPFLDLLD